jgi:hypothetical protein
MKRSFCFMTIYENFHCLLLGTQNSARKFLLLNTEPKRRTGRVQPYFLSPACLIKEGYVNG